MTIDTRVAAQTISRRPIEDGDQDFLLLLYSTTRDDIAALGLSDEHEAAIYGHQFQAQHAHYQKFFEGARFEMVMLGDQPVGRVSIHRNDEECRIIDIAILPDYRGRGIGMILMREIFAEAERHRVPVRLRVQPHQRVRHWYERLGFKKIADDELTWQMERPPGERRQSIP